jgi:hypothetical protein
MDALKGIGHACGHNLIAIAGVAVACAVKAVLEQFNIPGKIVLLGTPGQLLFHAGRSRLLRNTSSRGRGKRQSHPTGKGCICTDGRLLDVCLAKCLSQRCLRLV